MWLSAGMATAAAAAVEHRPSVNLPATLMLPRWVRAAAVERTPAAVRAPAVTPAFVTAVQERERVTDHDVAAFVDVVQGAIGGPAAGWVHYGLTSSDVVDTALGATLARAGDLLIDASGKLVATLKARAVEFRGTAMAGRTHGMHAEPTTFGAKLALWCLQADRDRPRRRASRTWPSGTSVTSPTRRSSG